MVVIGRIFGGNRFEQVEKLSDMDDRGIAGCGCITCGIG